MRPWLSRRTHDESGGRMKVRHIGIALACMCLLTSCAQKYEGAGVNRFDKDSAAPYAYLAVGPLDFNGQNPSVKAGKVMFAACPLGRPILMNAQATRMPNATRDLLIATFSCNVLIPGAD